MASTAAVARRRECLRFSLGRTTIKCSPGKLRCLKALWQQVKRNPFLHDVAHLFYTEEDVAPSSSPFPRTGLQFISGLDGINHFAFVHYDQNENKLMMVMECSRQACLQNAIEADRKEREDSAEKSAAWSKMASLRIMDDLQMGRANIGDIDQLVQKYVESPSLVQQASLTMAVRHESGSQASHPLVDNNLSNKSSEKRLLAQPSSMRFKIAASRRPIEWTKRTTAISAESNSNDADNETRCGMDGEDESSGGNDTASDH